MKKIIRLLFISMLTIGFSLTTTLDKVSAEEEPVTINVMENIETETLTIEDISAEEYREKIQEPGQEFIQFTNIVPRSGTVNHKQVTHTKTYPGNRNFSATMVLFLEVYSSGSFRQINSGSVSSRKRTGLHNYDWKQTNRLLTPLSTGKFPTTSVKASVSGYFTTQLSQSMGGGASIPGFSISGSVGTTYHYASNSMPITYNYSVY